MKSISPHWLLATTLVACGETPTPSRDLVRDSAGVTIVENADVVGPPRWVVRPEPVLALGAEEGDDEFGLIAGAVMLQDGTIAVADALARRVRFFDGAGSETVSAGRRGEGPGEFEAVDRIWIAGDDRVAIWDGRLGRYTTITSAGHTSEPVRLEATSERARHSPVGFLPDGRLVAESDGRELSQLDSYRTPLSILTFGAAGNVADTIATVPGLDMWNWVWEMGTTPTHIPFGRTTTVGIFGDAIWVAANVGYQLDRYGPNGTLTLQTRLDRAAAPLAKGRIEAYQEDERAKAQSSQSSKGGNELFGRMADEAPYPEDLPHYESFVIDDSGRLWVRDVSSEDDGPTRLTVFAPGGQVVGRAVLPSPFTPTQIRAGRAIGIWRDQFDLEHVRVYVLEQR